MAEQQTIMHTHVDTELQTRVAVKRGYGFCYWLVRPLTLILLPLVGETMLVGER